MKRRTLLRSCAFTGIALAMNGGGAAKAKSNAPSSADASTPPLPVPAKGRRIRTAFVIGKDAVVIDFSGPWEVFHDVSVPGYDGSPFELYTVAESLAPVKVSGGMTITADFAFDKAPKPDLIVVPALATTPAIIAWLKSASPGSDLTMSVCGGSLVLAEAGLLAGKAATTYHSALTSMAVENPNVTIKRGIRFVDDGNISTAAGLMSGIDLALHVVDRYFGRAVAERTAWDLEHLSSAWKDPASNDAYTKRPKLTGAHPLCPVCEMGATWSSEDLKKLPAEVYKGKSYYFCSEMHKTSFDKAPDKYAED
ncbi:MAG TPA: DJ-1/PfpI family protein [Methylocystis sp.]|nr:DJ-1/PfpI family protein [Methylocystis sp.]